MPPSRRRNNSSLFESSTIITANLIMASSSYLLSKITPRAPATQTAPLARAAPAAQAAQARPPVMPTLSVQPTATGRKIVKQPDEGEDAKVDERADVFIKRFRERTQSDIARTEEAAAAPTGMAAAWQPLPPPAVAARNWAGTVHGYQR